MSMSTTPNTTALTTRSAVGWTGEHARVRVKQYYEATGFFPETAGKPWWNDYTRAMADRHGIVLPPYQVVLTTGGLLQLKNTILAEVAAMPRVEDEVLATTTAPLVTDASVPIAPCGMVHRQKAIEAYAHISERILRAVDQEHRTLSSVAVELNGEGMTTRTGSKFTSKTIGNIYRRAKGLPSYEQLLLARVGTPLPTLPDAVREPQAVEAELVTDDDTPTSILTQAPDYSHSPPQMIEDEPPASPAPVLSGRLVEVPADQLQQALELASQAAAAQAKVAQYEAVIAQYDEKSKALLTQVERAQTIVQENVNLRVQVQDLKDQLQQLEFRNAHWLNTKELIQEALKSAPYPLPLQKKES